jgi:catechol 2,3-dioxygenase-like lactoylglutathione lyase family enzyme
MRLMRVTLRVRDQDEALRFYTHELGFVKRADIPRANGQRWVTVSPPEDLAVEIVLQPPEWFAGERREAHLRCVGENPTLVFEVEDCLAAFDSLSGRGVQFTLRPTERAYGIEADAKDGEGNTLVFLQPKDPA